MTPEEVQHIALLKEELDDFSREQLIVIAKGLVDKVYELRDICVKNKEYVLQIADALGVDATDGFI